MGAIGRQTGTTPAYFVNFHVAIPLRSGRAGATSDRLVEIHDGLFSRTLAEGDAAGTQLPRRLEDRPNRDRLARLREFKEFG